jgi:hypothetical protein
MRNSDKSRSLDSLMHENFVKPLYNSLIAESVGEQFFKKLQNFFRDREDHTISGCLVNSLRETLTKESKK